MTDFKREAINSLCYLQPQLEIKGFFYHLRANIWKHVQSLGLRVRCNEEPEFSHHLKVLPRLACVSPQNFEFDALADLIKNLYND